MCVCVRVHIHIHVEKYTYTAVCVCVRECLNRCVYRIIKTVITMREADVHSPYAKI